MLKNLVVSVLAVAAIFFGLLPHSVHCNVLKSVVKNCPSHTVHLVSGVVLFVLAVVVAQWDHLRRMM